MKFQILNFKFKIFASAFLLWSLSIGCGSPGAPLPPSLNIPRPVTDLRAARKSDMVVLSWTSPQRTTDGTLVTKPGKVIVERAVGSQPPVVLRELPLPPASKSDQGETVNFNESLSELIASGSADFATYTLEAVNSLGRGAGTSNRVVVPLVATAPAPAAVQVHPVPEGISVTWTQPWPPQRASQLTVQYAYRIKRRLEGENKAVTVAQLSAGNEAVAFVDTGIEWEKQYQYWVTPVTLWEAANGTKGEVEGDDSPVVSVAARDIFPPAVPTGVQAVFSGSEQNLFIDLTWNSNSEADLAGYNIYRHTEGGQPQKINAQLVTTPAFRDSGVQPGTKYFYTVSAVDQRGNESNKSEEASESVPQVEEKPTADLRG